VEHWTLAASIAGATDTSVAPEKRPVKGNGYIRLWGYK
jgi:hypothetical protein